MRYRLIVLWMLLFPLAPAFAQVGINFDVPGVRISMNVPVYPQLQRVPGYPVYYAPSLRSNYFFYDGLYWVYEEDNWYSSSWYNGPWWMVNSMEVPFYLLRVPVRYYRRAPAYFQGWRANDPPRWGEHWGQSWEQRRSGWNQWNRSSAPAPAPLPIYQRQYSGNRYPQAAQQAVIQTRNYRYQPNDAVAQQNFRQQRAQVPSAQPAPAPAARAQPAANSQPRPQQVRQPEQAPTERAPQTAKPQPQRAERPPQQAPAAREPQAAKPQPNPQQVQQPRQAPVAREQQAARPQQPQRAERPPQQAPAAREPQAARPQQPQRAERPPQQAPAAREPQAARQQQPQRAERPPQQAPAAQGNAAPGREPNKEQGKEKDNKGQDR
jgi:hypothetical protein